MKLNIYHYITDRAKFSTKNKTASAIKNQLKEKYGRRCYICNRTFSTMTNLQLEHKIPVFCGGHLFDFDNVALVCHRCHRQKTVQDKKIIKILKDLKIIKGRYDIISFYPIDEVIRFYQYFKNILMLEEKNEAIYDEGVNGVDYKQIFQKSNREENHGIS